MNKFKQKKSVLMIGNLTAFILFLAFFMVLGFSSTAYTNAIVEFRTQPEAMFPPEDQITLATSDNFTLYAYLEAVLPPNPFITGTAYGSFFDYDDSQLELVSYTAAYPIPWTGSATFEKEDDTGWHTAAGWASRGYTAPGYFEEGPDLLTLEITSPLAAPMHMPGIPMFPPILLATFEFHCIAPGVSNIFAMNRPDGIYGGGTGWDDSTLDWDDSSIEVTQLIPEPIPEPVPEPTTMLLLAPGLIGLVVFRRKFRKK